MLATKVSMFVLTHTSCSTSEHQNAIQRFLSVEVSYLPVAYKQTQQANTCGLL